MVELDLQGVVLPDNHSHPVVLLRHEMRILPILVGKPEAEAIQRGLLAERTVRPMTHDLIKNILTGLRAELKSVTIYRLENETFYAHLNVEQRNAQGQLEQVMRIDSRPSDGIALAIRFGCPILATEEVMDKAAQDASVLADAEEGDDEDHDGEEDEGEGFEQDPEEED